LATLLDYKVSCRGGLGLIFWARVGLGLNTLGSGFLGMKNLLNYFGLIWAQVWVLFSKKPSLSPTFGLGIGLWPYPPIVSCQPTLVVATILVSLFVVPKYILKPISELF
jgi:hypothetical protein